ncbi:MAG: hypothetical protein HKL96_08015 [Phycisphaerales bacterium]|nr:hypothetical protein [Phycisphaerales bacterium]
MRHWLGMMLLAVVVWAGGCSQQPRAVAPLGHGWTPLGPGMRAALAYLAKGHSDKTKLAFLANFKGLASPVAKFNTYMDASQGKLLGQLKAWASRHHISLTLKPGPGPLAAAERSQESADGDVLLHGDSAVFQHFYLIYMYLDFDYTVQIDAVLLRQIRAPGHPELAAYLLAAKKVNAHCLEMIRHLLKQYRWGGAA